MLMNNILVVRKHQHYRHPEVLAVFGEPRRMATSARGHPSRRRASVRLLRMTAECVARKCAWRTAASRASCKDVCIPSRPRRDDAEVASSRPCQSGALHLVSGPFGTPLPGPLKDAVVAQLVRAPVCGTGGRWFEPTQLYHKINNLAYISPDRRTIGWSLGTNRPRSCRSCAIIFVSAWRVA
jgi:hypothetical protein